VAVLVPARTRAPTTASFSTEVRLPRVSWAEPRCSPMENGRIPASSHGWTAAGGHCRRMVNFFRRDGVDLYVRGKITASPPVHWRQWAGTGMASGAFGLSSDIRGSR